MSTWQMIFFQDSNSLFNDNLISFHNLTFMIMLMIVTVSLYIMLDILFNKYTNRYLLKNHTIEILWTVMPIIVLMFICFPSLKILYYIDEIFVPMFTVKSIGHQWFWSYEYPEFYNIEFDSYMINEYYMSNFRLLDVDNRMVVPMNMIIRLIVSSFDVIHSWTVPSLGIKMDATPGRINQMNLFCYRPGVYYGQCSEICGMNHSFMPIVVESTSLKYFNSWIKNFF